MNNRVCTSLGIPIPCQILFPHMAERAVAMGQMLSCSSVLYETLTAQRVSPPRCSGLHLSLSACLLGLEAGMQHNHPASPRSLRTAPSSGWNVCHMASRHLVLSRFLLKGEMVPVLYCFPSLQTFFRVNESRLAH